MRIRKLFLAVVILSTGASAARSDGGFFDSPIGKVWGWFSRTESSSSWGDQLNTNQNNVAPGSVDILQPKPQRSPSSNFAPSNQAPNPVINYIENLFHKSNTAPEPYNPKQAYDPSDPFGDKPRDKASPQPNPGQNNQPAQPQQQATLVQPLVPPDIAKTAVICPDGLGGLCFRQPNGTITKGDQGAVTPQPLPQKPAAPLTPSSTFNSQPTAPTPVAPRQPSVQPALDPMQSATLIPCGDGSSAACYRTSDGKIIRTDQGAVLRPSSQTSSRWSLADARQPVPAATQPARNTSNDWANQQIKAIADGRPYAQTFNYAGVTPRYTVGGISLTKAAAERMPLNLSIEGLGFRDGQIILAGTRNSDTRIDAALFLTALRTACVSYDPYFSLDPTNGSAWSDQGREALKVIWNRVKDNFSQDTSPSGFSIQTFSVKRSYPSVWAELEPKYPELRTQLVFRPDWLRQTRFGEILYKADVLLKELTSGVSVLQPDVALRAQEVPGYIPSAQRGIARSLLSANGPKDAVGWTGHRLWFDLMPQARTDGSPPPQNADSKINRSERPELYSILHRRGFVGQPMPGPTQTAEVSSEGGVTDLSAIYPKMFVRLHDHATNQDIPGSDPDLDLLSGDVNERTAKYVQAYTELRDLTDIFRAYVAGVKIAKQTPQLCGAVLGLPLADGEKVQNTLPEFHPSELFVTIAQYAQQSGRQRSWQLSSGTLISGGISLRGKEFYGVAAVEKETPLIREIKQDLAGGVPAPTWNAASGRYYVAFNVDIREPPSRVPIVAAGPSK